MRKPFVIAIMLLLSTPCFSQWLWDYGGTLGMSNYLGDIGGNEKTRQNFIGDVKLLKTRWNTGAFIRNKWHPLFSWKFSVDYVRLEGNDKLSANPGRRTRNFNFKNDVVEVAYTMEYFIFSDNDVGNTGRYQNALRVYLFTGAGGFYTNPKTFYRGQWVALQPYATEGVIYRKFVFDIPMGIGAYLTIKKRNRFGVELNYRKTFTDYLDDISGNYPSNPPDNEYEQGLILRTTELNPTDYSDAYYSHTWGQKRGDPTHKDAFFTLNFTYSRVLRGHASFHHFNGGGFFGPKRHGRIVKAKF